MLTSLLMSAALLGQAPTATRYDMGERLKLLDGAWLASSDKARRAAAVPHISQAFASYSSGSVSDACRALDQATAEMQGRELAPEDALTLRFDPPFAEPKTNCYLRVKWAYIPRGTRPVRVSVGSQSVLATPGRPLTLEVHPERLNPELLVTPEAGYLVPVRVGGAVRGAYISLIKRPRTRIEKLLTAKSPEAREMATALSQFLSQGKPLETDVPIIQQLFTAELLEEGRLKLDRAEQLWSIKEGDTFLRVAFPKSALGSPEPVTIVVGLHGKGGSENMFFDAYGRGLAVQEALRRGWIFVSPRLSDTSLADTVTWLQKRRGVKIGRLFVLGHSAGGTMALQSGSGALKPAGVAVFAPPIGDIPVGLEGIPLYVAIGKQDALLLPTARKLGAMLVDRPKSLYEEFEPSEHMMIVTDALPAAFRFFDGL
jgi:hypothetical protein